jgi:hypothetical protein
MPTYPGLSAASSCGTTARTCQHRLPPPLAGRLQGASCCLAVARCCRQTREQRLLAARCSLLLQCVPLLPSACAGASLVSARPPSLLLPLPLPCPLAPSLLPLRRPRLQVAMTRATVLATAPQSGTLPPLMPPKLQANSGTPQSAAQAKPKRETLGRPPHSVTKPLLLSFFFLLCLSLSLRPSPVLLRLPLALSLARARALAVALALSKARRSSPSCSQEARCCSLCV